MNELTSNASHLKVKKKVAIVHFWLVGMRGGEAVLEVLCDMYPDAVIYTHVFNPEKISSKIKSHTVVTTFINKLPFAKTQYKKYLPLMPAALTELDLTSYDLVISSESGPAKGVVTRPGALHVCYVHSPMRYIWDQYHLYKSEAGLLTGIFLKFVVEKLRVWDVNSANSVDVFIANSRFIQKRVKKTYRRESVVIHPPVNLQKFPWSGGKRDPDVFVYFGQLTEYKGIRIVIEAFKNNKVREANKRLVVIGEGDLSAVMKAEASDNVTFYGRASDKEIGELLGSAAALIFPGIEDFGIVPIEVMSTGMPVIAYRDGGALDYILPNVNGIFFDEQSSTVIVDAILDFDSLIFDPKNVSQSVQHFEKSVFEKSFKETVLMALKENCLV